MPIKQNLLDKVKNLDPKTIKKMKIAGGAVGAGAVGADIYHKSKKNNTSMLDEGKNVVSNNMLPKLKAAIPETITSAAGAGLGALYAAKKGVPSTKYVMRGTALGSISGDAAYNNYRLYKNHKEEFGTAPSAKDFAKLNAANTLPNAAMWGAALNSKKVSKVFENNISNISKANTDRKKVMNGVREAANIINSKKGLSKEQSNILRKGVMDEATPKLNDLRKNQFKSGMKILGGVGVGGEIAGIPSAFVNPKTIVRDKKNKEDKTASEIIDTMFDLYK